MSQWIVWAVLPALTVVLVAGAYRQNHIEIPHKGRVTVLKHATVWGAAYALFGVLDYWLMIAASEML
ncbi:MAG: hypothetical protein AB1400_10115 [Pseudomonadota bacterium]